MSTQEIEARVKGRVWQAIAQSGGAFSAIPQADLETFTKTLTAGLLQEMDDLLTANSGTASNTPPIAVPAEAENANAPETVLWEGRPFLSISTHYTVTTERIRIVRGMLSKEREDIELVRIQDIDQSQGFGERLVNVGDITVHSHDPSHPQVVLENISNVQDVHEVLRLAVLAARKRNNFHYREQM
jgi:hypothetical protein